MMGHTHWVIGGASWLGGLTAVSLGSDHRFSPLVIAGGFGIAAISALEPDIDTKKSMASKMLGPITGALSWAVRTAFGGHRKITHSIIGLALVALGVFGVSQSLHLPPWIGAAVLTGWASHILSDMTTREGCPLLWPASKHKFGLHVVETGKGFETHFIRPLFVVLCFLFGTLLVIGF